MTDEILKKIDERIKNQQKVIEAYGIQGVDNISELKALRVAVARIQECCSLNYLDPEKDSTLNEIAAILGVKEGEK
jgi:hypothetical protein